MTRKLPWGREPEVPVKREVRGSGSGSSGLSGAPDNSLPRTPQPSRPSPFRSARRPPNSGPPSTRDHPYERVRSPSTSPPPEPLPEIPMREGIDQDDQYRMVEDEFVAVAHQFTAHLHRAEYQRLKARASSQNADTIADISRPVVGSLTELARKRQLEVLRKKKQRQGLRRAGALAGLRDEGSGDEMDVPWRGTALQGLMDGPRAQEVQLMALAKGGPSVEASATAGRKRGLSMPSSSVEPPAAASHSSQTGPSPRQGRMPIARDRGFGRLQQDDSTDEDDGDLGVVPVQKLCQDSDARSGRSSAPGPSYTSRSRYPTHRGNESHTSRPTAPINRDRQSAAHRAAATASSSSATKPVQQRFTDSDGGHNDDENSDDDIFTSLRKRKSLERPVNLSVKRDQKSGSGKGDSNDIIPSFF